MTIGIKELFNRKLIRKIDGLLIDEMQRTRAPALSIGVVNNEELVFSRNYGTINLKQNTPATSDSLYMIASITKSFTACGILKLIEEGRISLEDKIEDLIHIKIGFDDDPIRIKHLLTHSSGIPNFTDLLWAKNEEELLDIPFEVPKLPWSTWDDIYRLLENADSFITEKPGTRFYYNNLGYEVLGKIIEEVSGMRFNEYIKRNILIPLDMNSSGFYDDNITENKQLATPYIIKPNSKPPKLIPINYPERRFVSAAGGLFSSVKEMANYMVMLLNGGSFKGKQILNPEHIKAMQEIQFIEEYPNLAFSSFYGQYGETGYGFGLVIHKDFFGHRLIEHSGSYWGASAWMALIPELKIGVIFLSNHHPSPRMLAQALLMELIGKDCFEYHPLLRLRKHHSRLVGRYESYRGINSLEVISRNGSLFLKSVGPNGNETPLFPRGNKPYFEELDYYTFTDIGGKMPVQFTIDDNDNIWLHYERLKLKKATH